MQKIKKELRNKKIGVLLGGTSSEREVSLKSGRAVFNALISKKYNAVQIDTKNDFCASLKREKIDMAFIVLHGGHGENGAVQGMLEIMGIPYTGSGILASALAMDKEASKKIFLYHGIPVPPFKIVSARESVRGDHFDSRSLPDFKMPWVVKPSAEGSSVGVEIVKDKGKVAEAVRKAFSFGYKVVIEKYIKGKEVQIGILNNKVLG